jgi:hypothetical protein
MVHAYTNRQQISGVEETNNYWNLILAQAAGAECIAFVGNLSKITAPALGWEAVK